ncbi:hypothetical protein DASC09_009400 [Saccharomycopsis crataegensis]|uniref:Fatty acid desaturase domain-containing protein n=1 Tax=Saccharomycopsis crataegensis TaxID=43959 RepID=A0AAV5QGN3_9ASCO|nr:hypothetical protein DASC09_009400 [Saccharomycopsis crataegensis]
MSAVTVTSSKNHDEGAASSNMRSTTIKQTDNIATLSKSEKLTAIDTYGNEFEAPDYSIGDILGAIPKHCYQRSAIKGLSYVARDIIAMVTAGYLANNYIPLIDNQWIRGGLWAAYTIFQGLQGTGLWVLAHECGHRAFSDYEWLDHLVGWVLHSFWLVPFFSWKFTHSKHHKATGHLTRDMVFVPPTKEQFLERNGAKSLAEITEDSPITSLCDLIKQQMGGWIVYLLTNVTGQTYEGWDNHWAVNHFNPTAPIFDAKDYYYIILSDLGILTQLVVLYFWYINYGGWNVLINWFLPYLGVNHWLVFITFLQHSDPMMPHYDASVWNFARGAAATIDREFPFIGPYLFHDIIETHVAHHYCSRIPFYNARDATEAIKKAMGKHYMFSNENMWVALWKTARWCNFVDGDNGVKMFRNVNHNGVKPIDVDGKVVG